MMHDISCQQTAGADRLWRLVLTLAVGVPTLVMGCSRAIESKSVLPPRRHATSARFFEDVTVARGLPAKVAPWPDGTFATPEVTAGGVAVFDYDNDGRLDILQVCHGRPGHFDESAPIRLFHQETDGSFREVPNGGGLSAPGYGHGV